MQFGGRIINIVNTSLSHDLSKKRFTPPQLSALTTDTRKEKVKEE